MTHSTIEMLLDEMLMDPCCARCTHTPVTRAAGKALIAHHLARIPDASVRQWTERHLARTAAGERDLYL